MTLTIDAPEATKQAETRRSVPKAERPRSPVRQARDNVTGFARLGVLGAAALTALGGAQAAEPEGVTPWSSSGHAAARLIAAGPSPASPAGGGSASAGLEIRLDPGFITYWRNPGDAGLPPSIDTSSSQNVAAVTVDYPAPRRLDEGGAVAYGYTGSVTLPLHVTTADPARPAMLAVNLDYAICEKICLPATARLRLALPSLPVPEEAAHLAAAASVVPRPTAIGASGPLAVTRVAPAPSTSGPGFDVTVRAGSDAALFVEAPEGWYLQAGEQARAGPDGPTFHVTLLQRPDGERPDKLALRLTLVDQTGAIDVPVSVDAPADRP